MSWFYAFFEELSPSSFSPEQGKSEKLASPSWQVANLETWTQVLDRRHKAPDPRLPLSWFQLVYQQLVCQHSSIRTFVHKWEACGDNRQNVSKYLKRLWKGKIASFDSRQLTIDIPLGLSGKQLVTSLRLWKARGDDRGGGDVGWIWGFRVGEEGVVWRRVGGLGGGEELKGIDLKSLE